MNASRWSDDYRIVCDCQLHSSARLSFLRASARIARRQGFAVALAVSVGFTVVELPSRATLLDSPRPVVTKTPSAAATTIQSLSSELREHFSAPILLPPREDHLVTEKVREEFFRTEIPYGSLIYREAKRNDLPPELVAAVIKAESDFRPTLRSSKNAIGLMQILPSTGALMGASDLLDPRDNIRTGTRYLRYLYRRYDGDQTKVLAAYNAGPGRISRFGGIPPFRETQEYVRRVATNRAEYSRRLARRLVDAQLGIERPSEERQLARSEERPRVKSRRSRVVTPQKIELASSVMPPSMPLEAEPLVVATEPSSEAGAPAIDVASNASSQPAPATGESVMAIAPSLPTEAVIE